MVTQDEIRLVAGMMKIDIQDYDEYVDKVESMIGYFDILDSAGVEDEDVTVREIPVSGLREDRHVAPDQKLIQRLNHYKDAYVRAPKMS